MAASPRDRQCTARGGAALQAIEPGLQAFKRCGRHVLHRRRGFDALEYLLLQRQIGATGRTAKDVRIDAEPLVIGEPRVDVPGNEGGDLLMFNVPRDAIVAHPMLASPSIATPLKAGRDW